MSMMIYLIMYDWQSYNMFNPLKSVPLYETGSPDVSKSNQKPAFPDLCQPTLLFWHFYKTAKPFKGVQQPLSIRACCLSFSLVVQTSLVT